MCDNLFDDVSLDKQVDSFMKIETLTFLRYIMIGRVESECKKYLQYAYKYFRIGLPDIIALLFSADSTRLS